MTLIIKPMFDGEAYVGMPFDEAIEIMRKARERFYSNKEPTECEYRVLRETIRDCGWCLAHAGGNDALHRAHDTLTEEMDDEDEADRFSRRIEFAFAGIAGWYP